MAQTGFTPIVTYNTATATTVPSAANLAQGELAVNVTDKKLYTKDSGGNVVLLASNGGDVTGPASSTNLAIPTFSGTGGKTLLDNSGATISAGVITATGFTGALNGSLGATTPSTIAATTISASGVATFSAGSAGAPSITTTGDTNTGIFFPAANSIGLTTNGVVRTYWDASNHTLVGGVTTSRASLDYALQVETTNSLAGISAYRNQNVAGAAPAMWLGRSRGTTNGSFTAVQAADTLGSLVYSGADGTTDIVGASISAFVANTVSSNVVPTYLAFRTMNDAGTYAERMRLFSSGGVSIGNTTDPASGGLRVSGLMYPQQATTAGAPAYVKGAIYFDTTLNKLRVGGATAWETITSV